MDVSEFRTAYSQLFSEAWKLFKKWGMEPPKETMQWRQFSDETDELVRKHKDCGRLNRDLALAIIREVERLAGNQSGEVKRVK